MASTPAVKVLEREKVAHTLHAYDAEHADGHGQDAVDAGHESLEHLGGVGAECGNGRLAVALVGGMLGVVGVQGVGHPGPLEHPHRRGRRHGAAQ